MSLTKEERDALVSYRFEKAEEAFTQAVDTAKLNYWTLAANRLYYALFHASSGLLVSKGLSAKTHAGIISIISQRFVQKGLLTKEEGYLISRLQQMRQSGDYDDFFDWSQLDVEPLFEPTRALLQKIRHLATTSD